MAFEKIERRKKCSICKMRGICHCQERVNEAIASGKMGVCKVKCTPKGECGRTFRGGVCPCPDCW